MERAARAGAPGGARVKALVVGNGRVPPRAALPPSVLAGVELVVAADGGAVRCGELGLRPDLVLGDFDSIDPAALAAIEERGIEIRRVPAAKDESDLELALRAALDRGADTVVVLGALGGLRVEHELAALALLALGGGADLAIADDRSTIRLLSSSRTMAPAGAGAAGARLELHGEPGDYVSLLPWGGDAGGVTTEGLRFPLRDEPLPMGPSRGLSNEILGTRAAVTCRAGSVLVIHTRRAAVDAPSTGMPEVARPGTEVIPDA